LEPVLQIGNLAPDFSLTNLQGQPQSLSNLRGTICLLYFWSAECAWCKRVDLLLNQLMADWSARVSLLAISANLEETPDILLREAHTRGIWPVLRDGDQRVARLYGARTTPHIFILDAAGILRYQGAFDDVTFRQRTAIHNYAADAVNRLLAGRSPKPSQTPPYGCALTIL